VVAGFLKTACGCPETRPRAPEYQVPHNSNSSHTRALELLGQPPTGVSRGSPGRLLVDQSQEAGSGSKCACIDHGSVEVAVSQGVGDLLPG
jgi:hypothetical protein